MLEIENKYRVEHTSELRERLLAWGATADEPRKDTDHYFNAPDRDFAQTDEAFRIRRIGTKNYITYKGPKHEGSVKVRTEYEVELAEGGESAAMLVRILASLGYRPVAVVSKSREVFHFTRHSRKFEACLDNVGTVGTFIEIETLARDEELDAARDAVLLVAQELGLTQLERNSYLQLLLQQPRANSGKS